MTNAFNSILFSATKNCRLSIIISLYWLSAKTGCQLLIEQLNSSGIMPMSKPVDTVPQPPPSSTQLQKEADDFKSKCGDKKPQDFCSGLSRFSGEGAEGAQR